MNKFYPHNFKEIRKDCLSSSIEHLSSYEALKSKRIAITGGTGFIGTWLAELICALNDELQLGIKLDLYSRNISAWGKKYPHLVSSQHINLIKLDVRSSFEFNNDVTYVIHAAGNPNSRDHASDPLRVLQTTVMGMANALEAASKLNSLTVFINISSSLVNGAPNRIGPITENDCFEFPSGQLHLSYIESKRAAEVLAAIYRSQFRIPVITIRPFTFIGPYQEIDSPWAINTFISDLLSHRDIRIHGDGKARRSYLYGSDVAAWVLCALVNGKNGDIYNFGGPKPYTLIDLAEILVARTKKNANLIFNTIPTIDSKLNELYPDLTFTKKSLGVKETFTLEQAIDKTWEWFSQ